MSLTKYRLVKEFRSPKHGTKEDEPLKFKEYKKNDIVEGNILDAEDQDESGKLNTISIIITKDHWIIPFSYVVEVTEDSDSKVKSIVADVENKTIANAEKTKWQDKEKENEKSVETPISQKPDAIKSIVSTSKRGVQGALVGGGIGLGVAYFTNKNIWWGIAIGVVGGGIIGSMLKSYPKENENKLDKFINEIK